MTFRLLSAVSVLPELCLLAFGWKRRAIAFAAGLLAALSMAPVNFWPILALSLPMLVWLLDGAMHLSKSQEKTPFRTGFAIGWWFGFGFFLASLWWIGAAFLVDGDRFAWMIPLAIAGMVGGLALFPALFVAIAARFWNESSARIVWLALCLSAGEFVRGHVLTGFPWNAIGYAVGNNLYLLQSASIFGLYGVNLLVLIIFASPAVLIDSKRNPGRRIVLGGGLAALLAMAAFGWINVHLAPEPELRETDLRIIQPAIPQNQKWLPENRDWIFERYLSMSADALGGKARVGAERLEIWPESSLPFLLQQEPEAFVSIANALNGHRNLALGAIRRVDEGGETAFFNSVYLLNGDGIIQDAYDKVHLVPFGEYLPFEDWLTELGLRRLVDAPGAFKPGHRQKLLTLPSGISFLPLICYEAIFPELSFVEGAQPDFLLNVTNDAWFGNTPGPYQHLVQARMRAVEQGMPLVRAANTGISALIDAKGRILQKTSFNEKAILDNPLPGRSGATVFATYGNAATICLHLLLLLFWLTRTYNLRLSQ